ncbi:hypothetical protein OS493_035181 [Desmophyllum pertusum]|uniref:Uncharacterized protein n=1 Tax=Desmophyllum pertusum TaxID=174260 RepID=A0A9W9YAT4_9CNID|nr:hypothetical protein OS493_035181 [Desmophyllum pertusum]
MGKNCHRVSFAVRGCLQDWTGTWIQGNHVIFPYQPPTPQSGKPDALPSVPTTAGA